MLETADLIDGVVDEADDMEFVESNLGVGPAGGDASALSAIDLCADRVAHPRRRTLACEPQVGKAL